MRDRAASRLGPALAALLAFLPPSARGQAPPRPVPALAASGPAVQPPLDLVERVINMDEALRLARLNDPRLLSAEQDVIIAQERVKEARFLFLPDLGLQASATKYDARYPFSLSSEFRNILLFPSPHENIYSGRAYMQMSLYEGRRHINTLQMAHTALKQAQSNFESVRREVLLAVKEAFFRLLLAQERLEAAEKNSAILADLAETPGLAGWTRIEAEALVAFGREELAEARHGLDLSKLAFLKSLNLELDTAFRVVGELRTAPLAVDPEKAVLWAMELRPELQSETYKAEMDAIAVNLALGRRNPTLFLAGDYELTAQRFPLRQNNWDATIGLKLPFSFDYWTQIKRKRAEQRQGELKRAELQDRVRLEVRQAFKNLLHWQEEYPRRQAQHLRIKELFEAAAAQAPATTMARVRAFQDLKRLELSYLTAVAEHILGRAKLEWAIGRELQ